ncbi:MAG: glycosyltransferase family 2 protein [Candidatus Levybacteria bacterium]|nr:glycosyltransferase family 2 protein [Candidatus Levybacteria bacterium]
MSKVSAIVIVKNGENLIKDCLNSVAFCDEVIVVDSGSNDKTLDIAKNMGAKVYILESDNFSTLRNFGLEKAAGEWVLYVDVDERVSSALQESIKYQMLNIKKEFSAFRIKRKNFYLGSYEWPFIEKIERLFRKDKLKRWEGKLHESPIFDGEVGILDGFLLHYSHRDLTSMLDKTIKWSEVEAQLRLTANHPKMSWWRFPRVMLTAFFDSYIRQGGWKAGTVGIIESIYQSFSIFITYARLWEMQNKIKNHPFDKLRTKVENEK